MSNFSNKATVAHCCQLLLSLTRLIDIGMRLGLCRMVVIAESQLESIVGIYWAVDKWTDDSEIVHVCRSIL